MLTDYIVNEFLKRLGGLLANQGSCYIGLSSTEPNVAGGGITEPVGNGYARALFGTNNSSYGTNHAEINDNKELTNKDIIYFGEATGNWGTLTHYCLFSAATGGNLLAYGALTSPIAPVNGTVPLIRAGEIKITLARGE